MVYPGRKLKKILLILGITGAVYGGIQYLLPLVVPFLFAYAAALGLRPSVRFWEHRLQWSIKGKVFRIPPSAIGAVELVLLLGGLAGLLYIGGSRLLMQLEQFAAAIPQGLVWLDGKLTGICRGVEQKMGLRDDVLVDLVREAIRDLGVILRQSSMPTLMNNSVNVVSGLAELLIMAVIFFLATLMFLAEMDEIRERKNRSLFHREFALIGKRLVNVGSAWLKTELVIISVTSCLCTLGCFLTGHAYALLVGVGIGFLDALPFVGAGAVLIPWGVICLFQRQWMNGGILLALYVICYFVRQVLEAKLMGNRVGLSPVETLVSMYVGLNLFGLSGVLLGPIGLLVIEDLVDLYWECN